ncbi:MAG TPA: LytR family transcriptional regulator, partial [Enterococcus sp.]|nr:LytR family transcriptional regulator [Enterococcus sp.]
MSRMERNKELHKKLAEEKQTSKESIFARRTIAQEAQDPEYDAAYDQSLEDHTNTHRRSSSMSIDPRVPHTQIRQGHTQHNRESNTKQSTARGADSANRGQSTNQETKKQAKKQKNKQKQAQKKRKKRPFLRIVIRILLFLLIYSVGAFFIGQQVARSDASIPKDDVETFNGVTSADGSNNILLIGSDSREGET